MARDGRLISLQAGAARRGCEAYEGIDVRRLSRHNSLQERKDVMRSQALFLLWMTALAGLCGCVSGRTPDEAGCHAPRGCQGCVLLQVKFIDSDEMDWMGLGIERPQPDEQDSID